MLKSITNLFGGDPIRRQLESYATRVEAINALEPELRELSDELLRKVAPLDLDEQRLGELEQLFAAALALASAAERGQALLGAAEQLLAAIDDALDGAA